MTATTQPRRRWTETTIEEELRRQIDDLGHFPSRAELVARGLRSLWDAMRTTGGIDMWRERLSGERIDAAPAADAAVNSAPVDEAPADGTPAEGEHPDAEPAAPTDQQIAQRAYELYEQGAPGDSMSHWLAAKQELS